MTTRDLLRILLDCFVADIKSEDLPKPMKDVGALYVHNRDMDGKKLLIFDVKKHVKGAFKTEDMHRFFLYFLERVDRQVTSRQIIE